METLSNTLDFEKELEEWMKYGPHTSYPWCTISDAIKITAEHFYQLGFNNQSKVTENDILYQEIKNL